MRNEKNRDCGTDNNGDRRRLCKFFHTENDVHRSPGFGRYSFLFRKRGLFFSNENETTALRNPPATHRKRRGISSRGRSGVFPRVLLTFNSSLCSPLSFCLSLSPFPPSVSFPLSLTVCLSLKFPSVSKSASSSAPCSLSGRTCIGLFIIVR